MTINGGAPGPQPRDSASRAASYRSLNYQAEIGAMDQNGNGELSVNEFLEAQVGGKLARDLDGSTVITYEEFVKSHDLPANQPLTEAKHLEEVYWRAMFQQFDYNLTSSLDASELETMLTHHKPGERIDRDDLQGKHPRFDQFGYESQARKLLGANPYLLDLMKNIRVGDLVFVQGSGLVADATKGDWTHVAICTEQGPPPKFIESVGMTGSPGSRGLTRQSDFLQFVCDTDVALGKQPEFAIVRPTNDPRLIAAAVEFAKRQVGKPYDFAFSDRNGTFYCSELAFAAYNRNPLMPEGTPALLGLKQAPERNSRITGLKRFLRDNGANEADVGELIGKWNSGKTWEALKAGGKIVQSMMSFGMRSAAPLIGVEKPEQGEVSFNFVSPTLLLEGNQRMVAGRFSPAAQPKRNV